MAELLAKMVDYANHAQRHTTDAKARENVQGVLAIQGGSSGVNRVNAHKRLWRAKSRS